MSIVKDPKTPKEWRQAALMAHALRAIHDCKLYGLMTGGPEIDVERCDDIIERARIKGITFKQRTITEAAAYVARECQPEAVAAIASRPKDSDS